MSRGADLEPDQGGLRGAVTRSLAGEPLTQRAVLDALGGVRGIVETFLPPFLFLTIFALTDQVLLSAAAPALAGVVALVVRVLQRQRALPALTGLAGIVVCGATALLTGRAEDYFLPGLLTNVAWLLAILVSVILRWPLLGFVLGLATGSLTAWRENNAMRGAAYLASYVWFALFALRLLVQVPLYIADKVEWLGVARVLMGLPLFALVIIFTWLIFRTVIKTNENSSVSQDPS